MGSIELRWELKNGEKILQYRKQYDKTLYAGDTPQGDHIKHLVWTDWLTVPVLVNDIVHPNKEE